MGRWTPKYVIGLTGNIAMGKSTVRKMLENLGAQPIDADELAHRAMSPGAPAYAPVIDTFGKWILDADGKAIDRSKLGAVAFSHPEALSRLEAITHPTVGQAIDILISRAKQPVVVVEAIKLIEGTLASQVDAIWVVDATPEVQIKRLMTRRNMSEAEARRRVDAQNPQADKLAKANVIITNNSSPEEIWTQVQREWEKVISQIERRRVTQNVSQTVPMPPRPAPLPDTPTVILPRPDANPRSTGNPPAPAPTPTPSSIATPTVSGPTKAPSAGTQGNTQSAVQHSESSASASTSSAASSKPTTSQSGTQPRPPPIQIDVRRGQPKDTEAIARLLSQSTGRPVNRDQVMQMFGEKSLFMAESGGRLIGLAGIQVENLIARIDEFILVPGAPIALLIKVLLNGVEEAARDLLSEVGFVSMSRNTPPSTIQAFLDQGYERVVIDALRIPAWREAVAEMQRADRQILMKKLRDTLVLTPI